MMSNRDDFNAVTCRQLRENVGFRCSNPECRRLTVGPRKADNGTVLLGEAAHICAAAPGGPRYDPDMTPEDRKSYDNGIWLCRMCARLIDRDEKTYTVELLHHWKKDAEERTRKELCGEEIQHAPRFQIDAISGSGGYSNLILRITNVSSPIVSELTSERLYAMFADDERDVDCHPIFENSFLDRGQSTIIKLNNGFFGIEERLCLKEAWFDFNLVWRFSCKDEDGIKYYFEAFMDIESSGDIQLGKMECKRIPYQNE